MNIDNFVNDLTCPLTLELLDDPVKPPCCGQPFSRAAFVAWVEQGGDACPHCRASLENLDFDARDAPTERTLKNMVAAIQRQLNERGAQQPHQYHCTLTAVNERVAQLELTLENGRFTPQPTLIVLALDQSGSMSGNPWTQVKTALVHIVGLVDSNPLVKLVVITYQSIATLVDSTTGSVEQIAARMQALQSGGGTNFKSAFDKICEVLRNYTYAEEGGNAAAALFAERNVGHVSVAFLTDGQDGTHGERRAQIVSQFHEDLSECWAGPLDVHTIGFGRSHDREFLESIITRDGTFRYAEPGDDGDSLCHKIQSLFDMASRSSSVPLQLSFVEATEGGAGGAGGALTTLSGEAHIVARMSLDRKKRGSLKMFVKKCGNDDDAVADSIVIIRSPLDQDVRVAVDVVNVAELSEAKRHALTRAWLSLQLDGVAAELIALTSQPPKLVALGCGLILQRLEAIGAVIPAEKERIDMLAKQAEALAGGGAANINQLSDLRFASRFDSGGAAKKIASPPPPPAPPATTKEAIDCAPRWTEYSVHYSRSSGRNRNALQQQIVGALTNKPCGEGVLDAFTAFTLKDVAYTDDDGNNALHLACYCGMSFVLEELLRKFGSALDVNAPNNDNETPVTLAVKARGFWKCLKALVAHGAVVPATRREGLIEFTMSPERNGSGVCLTSTRDFLVNNVSAEGATVSLKINTAMTEDYIRFVFEEALKRGDMSEGYLQVLLEKRMLDLVTVLLERFSDDAKPTAAMLWTHGFPPKADHPETEYYLRVTNLLLGAAPELLQSKDPNDAESGDTLLHRAVECGNLPHVRFYLDAGLPMEAVNAVGNTPLWLACARRYPCIIDELLERGARIDTTNEKGNSPLYSVCQKGPLKVAEKLLARGASPFHVNRNGDTLVLLCCRNGQTDILKLLLGVVDEAFVDHRAHIDGFNAIFASVEADRPECIRALHEYGVSLEQRTADDNAILAGATPLHLAAYYGRVASAATLLELGANVNARDIANRTPLHIAVMQRHAALITALRTHGADIAALDDTQNTPAVYCRGEPELRKALVDPALDAMLSLAQAQFSASEESAACDLITLHAQKCALLGRRCISVQHSLGQLKSSDGAGVLMNAIMYSRAALVTLLLDVATASAADDVNVWGLTCHFWAAASPRIQRLLPEPRNEQAQLQTEQQLQRVRDSPHSHLLFRSAAPTEMMSPPTSGLQYRMSDFLNHARGGDGSAPPFNIVWSIEGSAAFLEHTTEFGVPDALMKRLLWDARVLATNIIASGRLVAQPQPNAKQLLALALFTGCAEVSRHLNSMLASGVKATPPPQKLWLSTLHSTLVSLPPFEGEVFIGSMSVERTRFTPGTRFYWPAFVSGTSLWRTATEPLGAFGTKDTGTVFIVHARRSGRHVGQLSLCSFDSEVVLLPGIVFRVVRWYRGNPIALGQANIREHTFGLAEEDHARYEQNNKSLIIELVEEDSSDENAEDVLVL